MVWGACRRVLADQHRAEDAFQQTFVTLARKAASIRRPDRLPGWLYGVARRTALQHRVARNVNEVGADVPSRGPSPIEQLSGKELIDAIEAEMDRLPERDRSAVVLCWFQDCSLDEAAKQLGMSKGRLWGRLKRAREALRRRLAHRGYGLPAVIGAGFIGSVPASAKMIDRAVALSLQSNVEVASTGLIGLLSTSKMLGLAAAVAVSVAGIVTMLPAGAQPAKDPPAKEPPAKAEPVAVSDDGFRLPAGAIHRFGSRQLRHPEGITASVVSPDGKYLATMGSSSFVVWDLQTLKAKFASSGNFYGSYGFGDRNANLAFLPDSKSILVTVRPTNQTSISVNEMVELAQVWDIEKAEMKFNLKGLWGFAYASWLCKEGNEIALLAGYDPQTTINYFDAKTGKNLRSVKAPLANRGLWISGNGDVVAAPDQQNNGFQILDAATGKEIHRIEGGRLVAAALSPDGKIVIHHDDSGKVAVHDVYKQKELFNFKHPADKQRGPMKFSKDMQTLYFGGQYGQLYRWDLKNNKRLPDVGEHSKWTLSTIALSPDESKLYSMGGDRLVKRWDLKTLQQLPLPDGYITQTATVPAMDGKHLIIADHQGRIDLWDLQTGKHAKNLQEQKFGGINCVAVSPDGKWLAGGRTGQDLQLWNLTNGKIEWTKGLVDKPDEKGSDHVQRVFFGGDGKTLFTASGKTGITAWEIPSGKKIWNSPQAGTIGACDPKGRWVVAGGGFSREQISFSVLDAKTGDAVRRIDVAAEISADGDFSGYPPYLSEFVFTPDGSRLMTAHYDGSVRSWDLDLGKELSRFKLTRSGQMSIACSADGRWLGVSRSDKKIAIYELASGKEAFTTGAHDSGIRDLAFTRDGRGVVGNADLSPVLWDLSPKDKDLLTTDRTTDLLWEQLAQTEASIAYKLVWSLAKDPKTAIKLFNERIKPAELAIAKPAFDKWLENLDHPQFRAREAAEREMLKAASKLPIAWIRDALGTAKSDEVRARLGRVLAQREKPDPSEWRLGRAVQILELAATDETKALLKAWAEAGGSTLSSDAKAALARITK
jgi:RNA polymerase sigma factor (sigma-70 family)